MTAIEAKNLGKCYRVRGMGPPTLMGTLARCVSGRERETFWALKDVSFDIPKGKTIGGIRTCEPCNGFSFHIVQGKYLSCDACGTLWDIETLQGVSGGCKRGS